MEVHVPLPQNTSDLDEIARRIQNEHIEMIIFIALFVEVDVLQRDKDVQLAKKEGCGDVFRCFGWSGRGVLCLCEICFWNGIFLFTQCVCLAANQEAVRKPPLIINFK